MRYLLFLIFSLLLPFAAFADACGAAWANASAHLTCSGYANLNTDPNLCTIQANCKNTDGNRRSTSIANITPGQVDSLINCDGQL